MAQDSSNPFVLPGFGQQGEAAGNPLLAGLDMMRQAWQNMAAGKLPDAPAGMPSMSLEDLERRIRELQTVQNWLQLNATMLASTIQGLEIQRSTLQTLQSLSGGAFASAGAPKGRAQDKQAASASAAEDTGGQAYVQAASDWWNLVQQQFEHLREATAASIDEMAEAGQAATSPKAAARKAAPKRSKSATSKPAAKASGRKPAARASASRSTNTRKSRLS
ncbi:MAG: PhaM family polyhydroxyalkanoate granule multifunctional regulatory protein [Castellaniella sp.]